VGRKKYFHGIEEGGGFAIIWPKIISVGHIFPLMTRANIAGSIQGTRLIPLSWFSSACAVFQVEINLVSESDDLFFDSSVPYCRQNCMVICQRSSGRHSFTLFRIWEETGP